MSLAQLYLDSFGNLPPVVRALAKAMDDAEEHLERLRQHVGFHDDWSPAYNRKIRAGATEETSWQAKCGAINGQGDLVRFIGEMAQGMDDLDEKVAEISAHIRVESTAVGGQGISSAIMIAPALPRRGRPPGSKNKVPEPV